MTISGRNLETLLDSIHSEQILMIRSSLEMDIYGLLNVFGAMKLCELQLTQQNWKMRTVVRFSIPSAEVLVHLVLGISVVF